MTRLLISAGNGPAECRLAVAHILRRITADSAPDWIQSKPDKHGPASAIISMPPAEAAHWCGTILWRCQSPVRPHHRRKNWFVGVFALSTLPVPKAHLHPKDLRFTSFRAGGPGGQHQNTTDSAVRVLHLPSGLVAVSRDKRSQHRNKAQALLRLEAMLALASVDADNRMRDALNHLHQNLNRGSPVRVFSGAQFKELS
ncbi:MAG: peptide chain release factor H [Rhodobacteraceae bacterium]|nr:peptide chain release factor H [Paracoccaceae bacterium]